MRDITLALFALACAMFILQDQAHSSALPQTPQDALSVELTDVECLALNIYHEARGESVKGHALVAQVTVNRMRDRHYPNTACGVVLQITRSAASGRPVAQFSWVLDGRSDRAYEYDEYLSAFLMAIDFLYTGRTVKIQGAKSLLAYHADWVSPDWHDMQFRFQSGSHLFYERRKR
jgi:spore germination cell wall hydrolase CwlJ-like protein